MVAPAQTGDSPGSVSSPSAIARGRCLRRSKNKVHMQWCFLQPIQEIHELDKVSLFTAIFGWFLWTFPVSSWTCINFWQCTTSCGKELCRCTACCAKDHVPLLCSVCGSVLWLRSARLSCISREGQTSVLGNPPRASPDVVDYWRMFVHLVLWCLLWGLGFLFLMEAGLPLLPFSEPFHLLIYHFWAEGQNCTPTWGLGQP